MDPLSDVLSLLRPSSYGFRGLDAGGDWGLAFAAGAGLRCYAIQSGRCWMAIDGGAAPFELGPGEFVLLPGGSAYRIYSGAPVAFTDAFRFFPTVPAGETALLNGGGSCRGVGGYFQFAGLHADHLLGVLPPVVRLGADTGHTALRTSIDRLMAELREPRPGSALIAEHLAQALLVEALRIHLTRAGPGDAGWLFALADRQIHAALSAMHAEPGRRWTLEELARRAGMSRSTFALRFREKVGEPVMDYLTRWRMMLAADRLANQGLTISAVAPLVGYQSESAFGAAFRRVIGAPPRQFARALTA